MDFLSVEFQRFGGDTGQLSSHDRYLRTIGATGKRHEVQGPLDAELFRRLMKRFDYSLMRQGVEKETMLANGDLAAEALQARVAQFIDLDELLEEARERFAGGGDLFQIDIVTRASELSQMPFEVLETDSSPFVITRRLRRPQLWPPTVLPKKGKPKVLFAWSGVHGSVPHCDHLEELTQLVGIYGGTVVEVDNASLDSIAAAIEEAGDSPFSHVHVLAHGVEVPDDDPVAPVDVDRPAHPPFYLALDDADQPGAMAEVRPEALADVFEQRDDRPGTLTLAVCDAGTVDAAVGSRSFAHSLHAAGIPTVVASQFPLTKAGSIELVRVFLAMVFNGEDPRRALAATRSALRLTRDNTYFDDVALVGYVHLNEDVDVAGSPRRQFEATFARLRVTTGQLFDKALAMPPTVDAPTIAAQFGDLRAELFGLLHRDQDKNEQWILLPKEKEECLGILASSFKREAESLHALSKHAAGNEADALRLQSVDRLGDAREYYGQGAKVSLDHHWAWLQWLSLDAVLDTTVFAERALDIEIARRAASEALDRKWALGSLIELWVLSAGIESQREHAVDVSALIAELDALCREIQESFPLQSSLAQARRYSGWWANEPDLGVDGEMVERARIVEEALETALADWPDTDAA